MLFSDWLISSFIEYAYEAKINISTYDQVCQILEFAAYINSTEMLDYLEDYMCDLCDKLNKDQISNYMKLSKKYFLDDLAEKLSKCYKNLLQDSSEEDSSENDTMTNWHLYEQKTLAP